MSNTARLSLPRINAGQAQKHVTHNEALALLDGLVHLSVRARHVTSPPLTPVEGERLIVGANATGLFAGKASLIAMFDDGAWAFLQPRKGWRAFSEEDSRLYVFNGAHWVTLSVDVSEVQNLHFAGIGTRADAQNPLAVRANSALFTALQTGDGGTGDLRFKLNKQQAAHVLSQLYQSNWSGRAETGLIGDERYRIKVSPDGSAWRDALHVDPATGRVFFPNGASDLVAAAPPTSGTPAAYVLDAPVRGPLPENALIWFVPHVPNATVLNGSATLQIEGVDSAPISLRDANGGGLAQGALEAGRAVCMRLVGNTYRLQSQASAGVWNMLEDGGRFAGMPEPLSQTVSSFADPAYLISQNGALRSSFGVASQNSSTYGGSAPAPAPAIADLCSKIRSGPALLGGIEFFVMQLTAGTGVQGGVAVQGTQFYPPLVTTRPLGRAQTFGVYIRVVSGSCIAASADVTTRMLVDGVVTNHLVDAASRIFTAATGWRHVQHFVSAPGGVPAQIWPLRMTPGSVVLVALPALVAGHVTLPWDSGAVPSSRVWR